MTPDGEGGALSHRQIMIVFSGLMAGMLVAALDQTIVATALPTIVGEIGGIRHLSWVVTAYILLSTISMPLYGKIGDLYGRKRVYQTAIVIFVVGSVLSGVAQSMGQLIAFRALQGIGAGGLMATAQAIVGDIVAPRQRGKYQGYISAVFAFASVVGPLVGGFFVDHLSWRWAFYVNVPIGAIALFITSIALDLPYRRIDHRIDFLGASLIMGSATSLILVTVWAGDQFAWGSPVILGLAALGIAMLGAFIAVEARAAEPLIPPRLWRIPTFRLATGLGFLVTCSMFGVMIFLPLYLQTVGGVSATNSGLLMVPLMGGILASSIVVGRLISRTGRYKVFPVVGTALMTMAIFGLSTMGVGTSRVTSSIYMVFLGMGMGMTIQVMVLAVQNSVEHRELGTATAVETFARSMGSSFGVAAFGAILSNRLAHYLPLLLPGASADLDQRTLVASPEAIRSLPPNIHDGVIEALSRSIHVTFLWAIPIAALAFFLTFKLKETPLRTTPHITTDVPGPEVLLFDAETQPATSSNSREA